MKKKNLLSVVLILVCLLSFDLALVGCKKDDGKKDDPKNVLSRNDLAEWENETEEAELYETYRLSVFSAYDKNGKAYRVTPDVKQSDGEAVRVMNNEFVVDYAGGYKITYSLTDESYSAPEKVVTLKVKNSDEPYVYFEKTRVVYYDDEPCALPAYVCHIDPEVGVSAESLKLEKISGGKRVGIKNIASEMTLSAGNYELAASVTAKNGKTGECVLPFRVRSSNERNAVAAFNDANTTNLYASFWDNSIYAFNAIKATFASDVMRNATVSQGSYCIEVPQTATVATCKVIPEIGEKEFVEAMSKSGAVYSLWLSIEADDGLSRSISVGTKTVDLKNGKWTNVTLTAEEAGYDDIKSFYKALVLTKFGMTVYNSNVSPFKLYFDSAYVSEPIEADFADVSCNLGQSVDLRATNAQNAEFYYELYDGTAENPDSQISESGTLTPRVAGTLRAIAHPVSNRYYSGNLWATVTVKAGNNAFKFANEEYSFAFGKHDRPTALLNASSCENATYRIESTTSENCFTSLNDDKISVYAGEYILYAETALDGTVYSAYAKIIGGNAPSTSGDIENFDDPSSLKNVDVPQSFTYIGDYKGATGVVKFDGARTYEWPGFALKSSLTEVEKLKQNYTADDYVAIRFCVENAPSNFFFFMNVVGAGAYADENYVVDFIGSSAVTITDSEWHVYYIKAKIFFDNIDAFFNASAGENDKVTFRWTNNSLNDAEIYIDWIKMVKASEKV